MVVNNLHKIVSTLYPDASYKMFHLRNNGSLPHTFGIKLHQKMTKDVAYHIQTLVITVNERRANMMLKMIQIVVVKISQYNCIFVYLRDALGS